MSRIYKDPTIEEIRARFNRITDECNGDLRKLFEYFRTKERQDPGKFVDRSALTVRRIKPAAAAHRVCSPKAPSR